MEASKLDIRSAYDSKQSVVYLEAEGAGKDGNAAAMDAHAEIVATVACQLGITEAEVEAAL